MGEAFGLLPENSEDIVPSESQADHRYLFHDWEELTLTFLDYLVHHIVDVPRGCQLLTPHDLGNDLKQLSPHRDQDQQVEDSNLDLGFGIIHQRADFFNDLFEGVLDTILIVYSLIRKKLKKIQLFI